MLNMSGTVLHTGLGRAALSTAATEAVTRAAGSTPLEIDLESGKRGDRQSWVRSMLIHLTGAEDALVVNNCAAAVVLSLSALGGAGREVVLSRGEMVEIGGAFRMPDIIAMSGLTLREVGCTNKTRLSDYESVLNDATTAILRCHRSNFAITGFHEDVDSKDLAQLARSKGIVFLEDQGNGCLVDTTQYGLDHERTLQEAVADGADLVMASGDKLLGGTQCGIILGKTHLIQLLRKHPLARAFRIDKLNLAGLAATLQHYLFDQVDAIPTHWALGRSAEEIRLQAEYLVAQLPEGTSKAFECTTEVGGGSMPSQSLPSVAIVLNSPDAESTAQRLRQGTPGILGYIRQNQVHLDCRTLHPSANETVVARLRTEITLWSTNS